MGLCRGKIQDCICVAFEAINMLTKKVKGGNETYKVDIHKVFDSLSWKLLLLVLTCFDFHPSFVEWISTILCSTMFSIRVMGSLGSVRQGSLISFTFMPHKGGSK